jgi:nucleoside phosphorylase
MATAPIRTILLVAAESREFAGLLRRCSSTARLALPLEFARMGELNGYRMVMVAHGPGPALAGKAADLAREKLAPDVSVSIGFCGALDPALQHGDVFVASVVEAGGVIFPARPPQSSSPYVTGRLTSMDRVAQTVEDKRRLRAGGASVVEMEAGAVALRAQRWGVPFSCLRVVTDSAGEGFALDFNRVRGADGRFSRLRILAAASRRPWVYFPELFRLQRRSLAAAKILGDFIASCEF